MVGYSSCAFKLEEIMRQLFGTKNGNFVFVLSVNFNKIHFVKQRKSIVLV